MKIGRGKEMNEITQLNQLIADADSIVVGAASGMSNATGLNIWYENSDIVKDHFQYYIDKYGFVGMFNGFYNQFDSLEEKWGYMVKAWDLVLNIEPPKPTYQNLKTLIEDKPFHIITTNQDTLFKRYFPVEKISEIQGSWDYMQNTHPVLDKNLYPARPIIEKLLPQIKDNKLPTDLIPRSEIDGNLLDVWARGPEFLEDKKYFEEYQKFNDFMSKHRGEKILFLELGVGRMTPMFIQEPFWAMTKYLKNAQYVNINPKDALTQPQIKSRSLLIKDDINNVLQQAVDQKKG